MKILENQCRIDAFPCSAVVVLRRLKRNAFQKDKNHPKVEKSKGHNMLKENLVIGNIPLPDSPKKLSSIPAKAEKRKSKRIIPERHEKKLESTKITLKPEAKKSIPPVKKSANEKANPKKRKRNDFGFKKAKKEVKGFKV